MNGSTTQNNTYSENSLSLLQMLTCNMRAEDEEAENSLANVNVFFSLESRRNQWCAEASEFMP